MNRRRWLIHLVLTALMHRRGRSLLLLAVLAMASSLATALGLVSYSMEKRVAEEVRKYGANLVILPDSARLDVGSGGLDFGIVTEPAYLAEARVAAALAAARVPGGHSFHLRGSLHSAAGDLLAEGVNFPEIRRLFPWWQMKGAWPAAGEAVVGSDLAARLKLRAGDYLEFRGKAHPERVRVSGVVSSGGEEDRILFVALPQLQKSLGLEGEVTQVRLLVDAGGGTLKESAAALQRLLPGARVSEVRQTAHTSEALLAKVKLLMVLVTAVVLVAAGTSVTGTLSTTVLERGKEIGLMKAMGGTRREVLLIFSGEALALGVLGGAVGFGCGYLVAEGITRTVFAASVGFVPGFAALSLGTSLFLALLGGLGPMVSVFKLDPVRSLRGE